MTWRWLMPFSWGKQHRSPYLEHEFETMTRRHVMHLTLFDRAEHLVMPVTASTLWFFDVDPSYGGLFREEQEVPTLQYPRDFS